VVRREDQDLFQRRNAFADPVECHHAQRAHPLTDSDLGQLARVGACNYQFAEFIADGHGLDDGEPPGITGILAAFAAASAIECDSIEDAGIDVEVLVHLGGISHRLFTMRTDATHEPLGASQNDRGGNQERRNAHIVQARDGAGCVVTVHGAEHLVPGERGFHGDFGGLGIADFTDHDDVRILAQNGPESICEGEPDLFFDGDLINAGNLKLNRVFNCDNVVDRVVKLVKPGVKGGGFA